MKIDGKVVTKVVIKRKGSETQVRLLGQAGRGSTYTLAGAQGKVTKPGNLVLSLTDHPPAPQEVSGHRGT